MQKLTGSSWNTPAAVRPLPCCSIRSGSCSTGARASHTSAPSASTPPSAAARSRPRRPACSTRSRRDCYRRLLPPGRTMPRRAMRSRCAGRTARRSALPAAMTARAFRTAGQSLPPRQIPCCASIRRASCSTRRAQPPRRGRCFTAPWNSSRTAHATPTAPKTGRWRPVSLWSFRPGRMRTSCWAGSSRCRPARPRTHPTRPRRQNRFSAAPPRRIPQDILELGEFV